MKETLKVKQKFTLSILKISRKDIIAVEVLPAAIVTLLSYVAYGAILTVIPDWSGHLGIMNKGLFFMVFTIASLLIRFGAGRVSGAPIRVYSKCGLTTTRQVFITPINSRLIRNGN